MAISLGSNSINKLYLGSNEIQKAYLGNVIVFDSTVIVDTLHPILYNFRLEDNTTRLYFDSSKVITGSTYTGFAISNKTINGIVINAGQTTGHYLTVTSAFNFWDNMTIRYDGSNNIIDGNSLPVYPFNLQEVDNRIPQPIGSGNIYYVTTSGNDGNDGESEGQAWRTLAYADGQLGAGDTLYVKAGNYGDDKMYFKNSSGGTIDEPILISGYQTTPGDITSNYYDYGVSMSSSEMPMVVGGAAVTRGVELTATDYFIIENMQWSGYRYGIYMDNSSTAANNMTFNRCNFTLQGDGDTDGYGFYSTGINNTKITLNDCRFFDASHSNCVIMGNNNAIYDTKAYAERTDSNGDLTLETDYHYVISGQFNKAVRSHAEHVANIEHSGHGFSLKNQYYTIDSSYKVEYCLIDDCTVTNVNGALELRHNSVKYNYVNNLIVDGSPGGGRGNGLVIRDGASYNTIDSCTVRNINTNDDWTGFLYFKNSSEDGTSGITMTDNVIQNCLFHTGAAGEYAIVWGRNAGSEYAFTASGTKFYNNTFKGIPNLQYKATLSTVSGTVWENNIFDTVSSLGTNTGGTWDYNLFYNGFSTQGTNAITVNPQLDANYQPQATFTDIDVPKISGINYGKNDNERQDPTTVGAVLSASEVPEQPPTPSTGVFPGAYGFGSEWEFTENYEVRIVTNLNDTGTGSLRTAITDVSANNGVIIVFNGLSGIIEQGSTIQMPTGHQVYIAGQTSENGIAIHGGDWNGALFRNASTQNGIIVRGIFFDRDNTPFLNTPTNGDCIAVGTSSSTSYPKNIIFDRCTFTAARDDLFQFWQTSESITIQNCIFAEPVGNGDTGNVLAMIMGADTSYRGADKVSMYNNAWITIKTRTPSVHRTGTNIEFVNNIIYNIISDGTYLYDYGTPAGKNFNWINNHYIDGPETSGPSLHNRPVIGDGTDTNVYTKGNLSYYRQSQTDPEINCWRIREGNLPIDSSYFSATPHDTPLVDTPVTTTQELIDAQVGNVGTFFGLDKELGYLNQYPTDGAWYENTGGTTGTGTYYYDTTGSLTPKYSYTPVTIAPGTIITDSNNNGIPDSQEGTWGNDTFGYVNSLT